MTSAYPLPDDELAARVRALAAERGGWPSKRTVMQAAHVGAPRAQAALDALREEGFDPARRHGLVVVPDAAQTRPERTSDAPNTGVPGASEGASGVAADSDSETTRGTVEPQVTGSADAPRPGRVRRVPRWPLLIIAAGAFVAIWSGWVGLGKLTGFGPVTLLPGIADRWVINSAITLPLGVEAYAAFAMWVWLSDAPVSPRARTFARRSALGSLALGALGQITYHLLTAAGAVSAPWWITALVSCLPVVVLGCGAALVHLIHRQES
jgi:hypothetical protein